MVFVFFIYGLAFFILGIAIFIYPKEDSAFKLSKDLRLIGAFGLLHGINEWIDMFMFMQKPQELLILKIARAFTMPLSFFFLILFGVKVITGARKGLGWMKGLAFILPFSWIFIIMASSGRFLYADIYGRYLLGFPGAILAACALILQSADFMGIEPLSVRMGLKISAFFFVLYAILAGIVVPPAKFFPASVFNYTRFLNAFGFPVQVLRAISAVIIAISLGKVLAVFDWEVKNKLKRLIKDLQAANEQLQASKEDLKAMNEELQSANEELISSDEEIKQANEELQSVVEELRAANEEALKAKEVAEKRMSELEQFNKLAVGRELKMTELKEKIAELEARLKWTNKNE